MPELPEDMYCSQQICIPPAFPYLLRQYAKAAIRTQPTDLLKWSTAYFRCLALNLPPPVKPRLEYPIPLDYQGLTPGWLKALVYQMPNAQSVSFKLLWDRWVGACLKHNTLIEILLLGRFTNNKAIPWWRFIALCAGHLTENLTHTMIMVCEILTEEPEGGSAIISLNAFMDIYRFLADIDASRPQHLPNIYFTDSVLGLHEQEELEKSMPSVISSEHLVNVAEIEGEKEAEVSVKTEEVTSAVESCPDIAAEERPDEPLDKTAFEPKGTEVLPDSIDKTFALGKDKDEGEDKEQGDEAPVAEEVDVNDGEEVKKDDKQQGEEENEEENANKDGEKKHDELAENQTEEIFDKEAKRNSEENKTTPDEAISSYVGDVGEDEKDGDELAESPDEVDKPESPLSPEDEEEDDDDMSPPVSKEKIVNDIDSGSDAKKMAKEKEEEATAATVNEQEEHELKKKKKKKAAEDGAVAVYESVDTMQEDTAGRFGSGEMKERRKLPAHELAAGEEAAEDAEGARTQVSKEAVDDTVETPLENYQAGAMTGDSIDNMSFASDDGEDSKTTEEETVDLPRYEWFDIPVVPGIGPTVPIELVEIVNEYMTKMAKIQHGVVMPRNIRHFACPPLEVFDFFED